MDVFFDDIMAPGVFMNFEIGKRLILNDYVEGKDFNRVGSKGLGFYFFKEDIDVEVYTKEGMIDSFDILLRNQTNILYLGSKVSSQFKLNDCAFDELLNYLNYNSIQWKFDLISNKSLSITICNRLQFTFWLDFETAEK